MPIEILSNGRTLSHNVSLVVYRDNAASKREVLVRYLPLEGGHMTCVPFQALEPGEEAIHGVQRLGLESFGLGTLSIGPMFGSGSDASETRTFLAPSTPQFETVIQSQGEINGWQYAFIPVSSIDFIWLTSEISVSRETLRMLCGGD